MMTHSANESVVQEAFTRLCEGTATWTDMEVMSRCAELPEWFRHACLRRKVRLQTIIAKQRLRRKAITERVEYTLGTDPCAGR